MRSDDCFLFSTHVFTTRDVLLRTHLEHTSLTTTFFVNSHDAREFRSRAHPTAVATANMSNGNFTPFRANDSAAVGRRTRSKYERARRFSLRINRHSRFPVASRTRINRFRVSERATLFTFFREETGRTRLGASDSRLATVATDDRGGATP